MDRGEAEATVADGHGSHAVPAADRAVGVPVQLGVVVRVQVNEPRRHNQARGIEHFGSVMTLQPADLGDLAVLDPDVGPVAWHSRAVHHRAASDDSIELCHTNPPLRSFRTRTLDTRRTARIKNTQYFPPNLV